MERLSGFWLGKGCVECIIKGRYYLTWKISFYIAKKKKGKILYDRGPLKRDQQSCHYLFSFLLYIILDISDGKFKELKWGERLEYSPKSTKKGKRIKKTIENTTFYVTFRLSTMSLCEWSIYFNFYWLWLQ